MKKLPVFDCCKHFSTSNRCLRMVEDQNGNKLQWWMSEAMAKKLDALINTSDNSSIEINQEPLDENN